MADISKVVVKEVIDRALQNTKTELTGSRDELETVIKNYIELRLNNKSVTVLDNNLLIAVICNYLLESKGINIFDTSYINHVVHTTKVSDINFTIKSLKNNLDSLLNYSDFENDKFIKCLIKIITKSELILILDNPEELGKFIGYSVRSACEELISNTTYDCPDDKVKDDIDEIIDELLACFVIEDFSNYKVIKDKLIVAVLNYYLVVMNTNYLEFAPVNMYIELKGYSDINFINYLKKFKEDYSYVTSTFEITETVDTLIVELLKCQEYHK